MIRAALRAAVAASVLVVGVPAMAQAQVSAALSQKAADAGELVTIAQSRGSVRVIVTFATTASVGADASALPAVQAEVAQTQNAIISTHFGSADAPMDGAGFPRSIRRFPITPGFAVNVSQAELNALSNDSRITAIHLDRLNKPLLNQVLPLIGMPAAYTKNGTGNGQMIAVIDTGVQSNHAFLSTKVISEACFSNSAGGSGSVSLCPNGTTSQTGTGAASPLTAGCINGSNNLCTHGTHVAGIAAGNNTNLTPGEPVSGVAKSASIMAIQVFTRFNTDADCGAGQSPCVSSFTSDTISALNFVAANLTVAGQKAIAANMSLGGSASTSGTCDSDPHKSPIDTLRTLGVATLIAAGNDSSTTLISAPGCISTAVTIGSTTKNDLVSSFSNMSAVVDLLAPGGEFGSCSLAAGNSNLGIVSSIPNVSGSTNVYTCFVGTSMATPAAAGAFAAVKSACPSASIASIEAAFKSTGLNITDQRAGGVQTKPRIRVDQTINALCGTNGLIAHDFDGDGKSDIVWRNTAGDNAFWFMNGATITSVAGLPNVPTNWYVVGQRDFNGDGKTDLLWASTTGDVAIWLMNGSTILSVASLGNVGANWGVAGTADFNGDGKGDILWRSTAGDNAIWFMNGTTLTSIVSLGNIPTNWAIAGTADFDGDGKGDILWRNSAGDNAVWLMNGSTITSVAGLGNVPTNWSVVGTADFNADSKGDIVWRNSGGDNAIWLMNGSTISSVAGLGNIPTNWSIVSNGDYNGDGKGDFLWRNSAGDNAIWFMNGTTLSSIAGLGNVPTNWTIQNAAAN